MQELRDVVIIIQVTGVLQTVCLYLGKRESASCCIPRYRRSGVGYRCGCGCRASTETVVSMKFSPATHVVGNGVPSTQ